VRACVRVCCVCGGAVAPDGRSLVKPSRPPRSSLVAMTIAWFGEKKRRHGGGAAAINTAGQDGGQRRRAAANAHAARLVPAARLRRAPRPADHLGRRRAAACRLPRGCLRERHGRPGRVRARRRAAAPPLPAAAGNALERLISPRLRRHWRPSEIARLVGDRPRSGSGPHGGAAHLVRYVSCGLEHGTTCRAIEQWTRLHAHCSGFCGTDSNTRSEAQAE
jgi:hypothetical protein